MSDTPVPKDHPLMKAWEEYKVSDNYANTRKWALHAEHVDGSLWAAFMRGWEFSDRELTESQRQAALYNADTMKVMEQRDQWKAMAQELAKALQSARNWIPKKYLDVDGDYTASALSRFNALNKP